MFWLGSGQKRQTRFANVDALPAAQEKGTPANADVPMRMILDLMDYAPSDATSAKNSVTGNESLGYLTNSTWPSM